MCKLKIMLILLICIFFSSYINATDCLIKDGAIADVGIGDTKEKIFSTFASKYQIVEKNKPNSVQTLNLYQNKRLILKFSLDADNKIIFVDAYGDCLTSEKIGIGTTISDAIKNYGKCSLTPTDEGYLINFEKTKKISFLLDNHAIPKRLRNIPDDVFTKKQEKEILNLKNVRIKSIKINWTE